MINLSQVTTLIQLAGVTRLKIRFDNNYDQVFVEYTFKGKDYTKTITYQEVIDVLAIGPPGTPAASGKDAGRRLNELSGET